MTRHCDHCDADWKEEFVYYCLSYGNQICKGCILDTIDPHISREFADYFVGEPHGR